MALVGNVYIQPSSSDPGAVGFGYEWSQSDTGSWYFRNTSNTAWVFAFNSNIANLGMVPLTGATMTGALLGATGLMPLSGGDFSVAPTILGNPIATVAYVDSQVSALQSSITTQIASAIAQIPGLAVGSKIAIGAGIVSVTMPASGGTVSGSAIIPLPIYGDGTTATQAEVNGRYSAAISSWSWGDSSTAPSVNAYTCLETTPNTRNFTVTFINNTGVSLTPTVNLSYIIVGIKAT